MILFGICLAHKVLYICNNRFSNLVFVFLLAGYLLHVHQASHSLYNRLIEAAKLLLDFLNCKEDIDSTFLIHSTILKRKNNSMKEECV